MAFKSKSGAKKRFRLTGSGTFKHAKAGRQHLATGDTRKTIRELGKTAFVTDADRKTLMKLIKSP